MRQVPVEQVCEYAAEDADVTLQLKNRLEKELKTEKMEKLFYDIEMPLTKVLADMEITGQWINQIKSSSDIHSAHERVGTRDFPISRRYIQA